MAWNSRRIENVYGQILEWYFRYSFSCWKYIDVVSDSSELIKCRFLHQFWSEFRQLFIQEKVKVRIPAICLLSIFWSWWECICVGFEFVISKCSDRLRSWSTVWVDWIISSTSLFSNRSWQAYISKLQYMHLAQKLSAIANLSRTQQVMLRRRTLKLEPSTSLLSARKY